MVKNCFRIAPANSWSIDHLEGFVSNTNCQKILRPSHGWPSPRPFCSCWIVYVGAFGAPAGPHVMHAQVRNAHILDFVFCSVSGFWPMTWLKVESCLATLMGISKATFLKVGRHGGYFVQARSPHLCRRVAWLENLRWNWPDLWNISIVRTWVWEMMARKCPWTTLVIAPPSCTLGMIEPHVWFPKEYAFQCVVALV